MYNDEDEDDYVPFTCTPSPLRDGATISDCDVSDTNEYDDTLADGVSREEICFEDCFHHTSSFFCEHMKKYCVSPNSNFISYSLEHIAGPLYLFPPRTEEGSEVVPEQIEQSTGFEVLPSSSQILVPAGMKDTPASKFLSQQPGIVFPIDPSINREALRKLLCEKIPESTQYKDLSRNCPWYQSCEDFDFGSCEKISSLGLEKDQIHVGYALSVPVGIGLVLLEPNSDRGEALLRLLPCARSAYDPSNALEEDRARAVFPFLKPKSRSDPDAVLAAEEYLKTFCGVSNPSEAIEEAKGRAALLSQAYPVRASLTAAKRGLALLERHQQAMVSAIRRANKVLRDFQIDPYRLASHLLGRPVLKPKGRELLCDDAADLRSALSMGKEGPRWLAIDFEAAVVGKHELSVPIEVAVVEVAREEDSFGTLNAAISESANIESAAVTRLLDSCSSSTIFYACIFPGQITDRTTAARLSLLACKSKRGVSGHGIPFDGIAGMRNDYRTLAHELVYLTGQNTAVINNSSKSEASSDISITPILINKGPTLVDLMCFRWCLAAANLEFEAKGEAPLYDISIEAMKRIPMFEISTVAKLIGMVRHTLAMCSFGEGATAIPLSRKNNARAETEAKHVLHSCQVSDLPQEGKILCSCAYHWDLYSSGAGKDIAGVANERLGGDGFLIEFDDDLMIDIHCARSDAFYLKCQLDDILKGAISEYNTTANATTKGDDQNN